MKKVILLLTLLVPQCLQALPDIYGLKDLTMIEQEQKMQEIIDEICSNAPKVQSTVDSIHGYRTVASLPKHYFMLLRDILEGGSIEDLKERGEKYGFGAIAHYLAVGHRVGCVEFTEEMAIAQLAAEQEELQRRKWWHGIRRSIADATPKAAAVVLAGALGVVGLRLLWNRASH